MNEATAITRYLSENPSIVDTYGRWHASNPYPWPPYFPFSDPRGIENPWPGNDPKHGSKSLRMHRSLIEKFDKWRSNKRIKKLSAWNPSTRIPHDIPDGTRKTNDPHVTLPSWFTIFGSKIHEPATFNTKLGDFSSETQLGTVISWWKNAVHVIIGGNMACPTRALVDPIFWRLSKYIDNIYAQWEKIERDNARIKGSFEGLPTSNLAEYLQKVPDNLIFGGDEFGQIYKNQYSKGKVHWNTVKKAKKLTIRSLGKFSVRNLAFALRSNRSSVRLHIKVLQDPTLVSVKQMVLAMQRLYASVGISASFRSFEKLDIPNLLDIDVGNCSSGSVTGEQDNLFSNRSNVGPNEIVVYFVRSTTPPLNGCAAHPPGMPSCIITQGATVWTLAHEVGHVLDLFHVMFNDRLMTGRGTANIINPPPDLIEEEIMTMNNSVFATRV